MLGYCCMLPYGRISRPEWMGCCLWLTLKVEAPYLVRERLPLGSTVTNDRLKIPHLGIGMAASISGGSMVTKMVSDRDGIYLTDNIDIGIKCGTRSG